MSANAPRRQMAMVAFLQAQNCSNYPASWRHPSTAQDFLTAEYYQRIGRTLEAGKFQLAFFDDRLAMPDRYGDDFAASVRHGIRVVKLDLIPLLTAMGMATRHLGLGGTYSTTYYEPFHVARVFATLDHMVGGRAAWNVVTSLNDSEAANFGQSQHLDHDTRYDRADEFMQAVLGHWDTWEDDAIVLDRERGIFADPAKVHLSKVDPSKVDIDVEATHLDEPQPLVDARRCVSVGMQVPQPRALGGAGVISVLDERWCRWKRRETGGRRQRLV